MRLAVAAGFLALITPGTARAGDEVSRPNWRKRWIASWVAIAAASVVDVHSSRGQGEANPLFRNSRGRFATGRAVLLKSAIAGGFFGAQFWLIRAHPESDFYQPFTFANTAVAGGLGAATIHNYSLQRPSVRPVSPADSVNRRDKLE